MNASTAAPVTVRAPAKVNLELRVGAPDESGYHPLSTVFHAVDLVDDVTVRPARKWSVTTTGPYADRVPTGEDNLVVRAAKLLADRVGLQEKLAIEIVKAIPVAGGMAGGSADGAAALMAADALWDTGLSPAELQELAAQLGSDVPFALHGGTAIGSGRGEHLVPVLARGGFEWVFALQHEGLSTPAVYAECDRLREGQEIPDPVPSVDLMAALRAGDVDSLAENLHNDLQPAAISLMPKLQRTMEAGIGAGALGAIVSGSGPTVAFLSAGRADSLDLMVALSATNVADEVVRAVGPVHGCQVVQEVTRR